MTPTASHYIHHNQTTSHSLIPTHLINSNCTLPAIPTFPPPAVSLPSHVSFQSTFDAYLSKFGLFSAPLLSCWYNSFRLHTAPQFPQLIHSLSSSTSSCASTTSYTTDSTHQDTHLTNSPHTLHECMSASGPSSVISNFGASLPPALPCSLLLSPPCSATDENSGNRVEYLGFHTGCGCDGKKKRQNTGSQTPPRQHQPSRNRKNDPQMLSYRKGEETITAGTERDVVESYGKADTSECDEEQQGDCNGEGVLCYVVCAGPKFFEYAIDRYVEKNVRMINHGEIGGVEDSGGDVGRRGLSRGDGLCEEVEERIRSRDRKKETGINIMEDSVKDILIDFFALGGLRTYRHLRLIRWYRQVKMLCDHKPNDICSYTQS
eukprot:GHVQ01036266.1.p1 GENE.GHVQ01036266.1~~GHVQ01036266.1.p1  ORF type:complete len:376 (-),score=49.60 GHVQ01036266.1:2314-3441(-)